MDAQEIILRNFNSKAFSLHLLDIRSASIQDFTSERTTKTSIKIYHSTNYFFFRFYKPISKFK